MKEFYTYEQQIQKLKEKGLISIDTYRDEQGHTRNRYTINT